MNFHNIVGKIQQLSKRWKALLNCLNMINTIKSKCHTKTISIKIRNKDALAMTLLGMYMRKMKSHHKKTSRRTVSSTSVPNKHKLKIAQVSASGHMCK